MTDQSRSENASGAVTEQYPSENASGALSPISRQASPLNVDNGQLSTPDPTPALEIPPPVASKHKRKRVGFSLPRSRAGSLAQPRAPPPDLTTKPSDKLQVPQDDIEELRETLRTSLGDSGHNPPGKESPAPSKGVLRSGNATPPVQLDGIEDDVTDRKARSADAAHMRAQQIREDVSRPSSPTKHHHHHHHKRSFAKLFHSAQNLDSGANTPEELYESDFVPAPTEWRLGGFSAARLLQKLQNHDTPNLSRRSSLDDSIPSTMSASRVSSEMDSPRGGSLSVSPSASSLGLSALASHATSMGSIGHPELPQYAKKHVHDEHGHHKHSWPSTPAQIFNHIGHKHKKTRDEHAWIKTHVQETAMRQRFLVKLARALMQYGAPTHRLEEYMRMCSRVLEIEAQFLYIPGCMLISFDDSSSRTTEMRLVRTIQGVDLGKLRDTHDIYKDVVHDRIGVQEATEVLDEILAKRPKYSTAFRVFVYGIGTAAVGPYAFNARWIDLPILFLLGLVLGLLHLVLSPQNDLYTTIFELVAAFLTSFLARMFGSLQNGNLFCFSALAQSSLALILPGYSVLCGALELQSKSIVAGSVRLVYAIIYSFFLGFGLTLGIAVYGAIDHSATSELQCQNPISGQGYWVFLSVIIYSICLCIVNQAKWRQMPFMVVVAFTGYVVSYFSTRRFGAAPEIPPAFGSLVVAFMANMNSRIGHTVEAWAKDKRKRLEKRLGFVSLIVDFLT